jgi:GTP-binding protein EngB required for normal cell division
MGSSPYLRLNISICGVNQLNEQLINRLFPDEVNQNKRELRRKDDNIYYTAKIFRGQVNQQNTLNRIIEYINRNFDYVQNVKKEFPKNILLYFSDQNATFQQNKQNFISIANRINTLPELKLPFIAFLSYGEIGEIRQGFQGEFEEFQDRRKITILKLMRIINIDNNERERNKEINYRKILSYLWEMTLLLNQKPYTLSKTPEANFFRIREVFPTVTINILLCGFSRKGKSTFINMIFDKMATLENPSFLPVTSEIIEFLLPGQADENNIVKGGVKIFDVPGLIEGTTDNMSNIEKLVDQTIKNQEDNFDVIHYILFFLSPDPNFQNTSSFLRKLNNFRIKVIFIINRDQPRENGRPNVTKQTLIAHLRSLGFNNLIIGEGNNILEVDLIRGVEGRTSEIFRYIYDDLMANNRLDDNAFNQINALPNRQLFNYLHNNFNFFSRISSVDDLIERGNRISNFLMSSTIPLIIAAGFSPIPFIDTPIFILLTALMLINIFKAYGFNINIQIFRNFFNNFIEGNNVNDLILHNNDENTIRTRILRWLNGFFENIIDDENTRFIIEQLIRIFVIRIGISAILGLLAPFGFGIIKSIIKSHFIYDIGKKAKTFLTRKIRDSGGRQNIINICEGYRDSISLFARLRDKNDWTRKIQILNS